MDFSAFDKQVNLSSLSREIEESIKNGGTGDYPEVPEGEYRVKLEKLELGSTSPSKGSRPMVKAMFRIIEGEYKKQCLFFNRVIYGTKNDANMIAGVLTWLEELEPSEDVGDIVFTSYSALSDLILDIAEDVAELEYDVNYDPSEFNSISIVNVYD